MTPVRLTRCQARLLDAVVRLTREKGFPPSQRELCAALGMASLNGPAYHIKQLLAKGLLERDYKLARTLVVPRLPCAV